MTDQELEQRLRNWYRAEISEAQRAPAALRTSVAAIPQARSTSEQRMPWRFWTMSTATRLAAAAVIGVLAIGGAVYVIQRGQPAIGGPSPTPSATPNPSESTSPSARSTSSVVPARAASWSATGSMGEERSGASATLLRDGKVLVAGGAPPFSGFGTTRVKATAELYDPASGTWAATGSLITPRSDHTATLLLDGKVLVAGGIDGQGTSLASAELYDPASGTWTATGSMITPRTYHTVTLLRDGRVLVAGGFRRLTGRPPLASAELYDPASGTWSATGNMVEARLSHSATLLPTGDVLVAGGTGISDAILASSELYDPATRAWTGTGNMTIPRVYHTATLLPDGRVLVAGGVGQLLPGGGSGPVTSAELYDPRTATWAATGSMSTTRCYHAATLLGDGKVLVAGGESCAPSGAAWASVELYDPTGGTWTPTVSMASPRSHRTATLLLDGKVLVVGGGPNGTSCELYDPGSGTS